MTFKPLASSSAGNAYILSDGNTSVLLDCGVSFRKLQQLSGFCVASLDGCLISHEHKDHSRCVDKVIKSGVPTYMSQGTAIALDLPETLLDLANEATAGELIHIGTMDVMPFPAYHDTEEPLGYLIKSRIDHQICAYCIDTVNLPYRFPGVTILAVEANYDPVFFKWLDEAIDEDDSLDSVKRRQMRKVARRTMNTHMSIDRLCECLQGMDLSSCTDVYLMHLSDRNSNEGVFLRKVSRVVPARTKIHICAK